MAVNYWIRSDGWDTVEVESEDWLDSQLGRRGRLN